MERELLQQAFSTAKLELQWLACGGDHDGDCLIAHCEQEPFGFFRDDSQNSFLRDASSELAESFACCNRLTRV
eukprot:1185196-Rhodomonas_salina.2